MLADWSAADVGIITSLIALFTKEIGNIRFGIVEPNEEAKLFDDSYSAVAVHYVNFHGLRQISELCGNIRNRFCFDFISITAFLQTKHYDVFYNIMNVYTSEMGMWLLF